MTKEIQYDVFLSHNSQDKPAVELLARRLTDEAGLRPFLDKWHLVPGEPWQEALEEALEKSETVVVFVGPSGVSPWHNEEMRAALDQAVRTRDEYRVIPVLLPGATEASVARFLARRTWVDFRPGLDDADAFARLVAGILGQPPAQVEPFTLPDEPAPYPGLLPFTPQQSAFFFGRMEESAKLLERVRASSFVAVVGASGSGKSSLVLAGLLPALDEGWQTLTLVPGSRPLRALADQLGTLGSPAGRLRLADDLETRLADRTDGLSTAVSTLLADRPDIATLLIVVDQFEELFTQVAGAPEEVRQQQRQFIANLVDAVHTSGGRVRVVLTLRADFVQYCLESPDLRVLLESNQLLLGPMGEDALREAIAKPAQMVGAMFEKGLVARLMEDMRHQPAALPLMQFALAQLWQRRHGVWLTHAAYEGIGGVSGAIDKRAETEYNKLSESQKHLARNLFVRLVTPGEDTSDTRRRVRREELDLVGVAAEDVGELIGILSRGDVRLIVADADTVELAHEALIEQWTRLRNWLAEDRAGLLLHRGLTEAAAEWDRHGQDASYLYRGSRLAEAEAWAKTHSDALNQVERAFLDSSMKAHKRRQAQRIALRTVAVVLVAVLLLAMIAELGPFAPRLVWTPVLDFAETEVSHVAWGNDEAMYVGMGERASTSSVARSRDSGVHWEFLDLSGQFVWSLLPDPYQANVIYASLGEDGLFRSEDGGDTWAMIGSELPMQVVDALAVSPMAVLYAGDFMADIGVYASHDRGDTWLPLPGTPEVPVYFLDWADDRLLIGTNQGLWQWTADGQWTHLLDKSVHILSAVSTDGVLFAGGNGIFKLREGVAPQQISSDDILSMDMITRDRPLFVASTVDGNVLQWRLGDTQVRPLARGTHLGGASWGFVIRTQPGDRGQFWVGTDNGLQHGEKRRWFEAWRR